MRKSVLLFLILTSCVAPNATRKSLLGEWQLAETLIDIGDGNGTWNEAAEKTSVSFFDDGKLWSDDPFFSMGTLFELKKDSLIIKSSDTTMRYFFQKIAADSFVIRPNCVEACGYKYGKLKD